MIADSLIAACEQSCDTLLAPWLKTTPAFVCEKLLEFTDAFPAQDDVVGIKHQCHRTHVARKRFTRMRLDDRESLGQSSGFGEDFRMAPYGIAV